MLNKKQRVEFVAQNVNAMMTTMDNVYKAKLPKDKTNIHLAEKDNGEWGYHINKKFGDIAAYMVQHDLKSIIDLGSGIGHGIMLMNRMGFKVKGYENEDALIQESKEVGNVNIEKKDIMSLVAEDIANYDVLYCYEPFKDPDLQEKFLTNLFEIMYEGQVFLYKTDSHKRKSNFGTRFSIYKTHFLYKKNSEYAIA